CVAELRKALDDDPRHPRLIRTVAKSGYRFIGSVEEIGDTPQRKAPGAAEHPQVSETQPRAGRVLRWVTGEPVPLPTPPRQRAVPGWRVWMLAAGMVAAAVFVTSFRTRPTSAKQPGLTITDNMEAYGYYSLGVQKAAQFHSKEAVALFEKAVALDPGFAM